MIVKNIHKITINVNLIRRGSFTAPASEARTDRCRQKAKRNFLFAVANCGGNESDNRSATPRSVYFLYHGRCDVSSYGIAQLLIRHGAELPKSDEVVESGRATVPPLFRPINYGRVTSRPRSIKLHFRAGTYPGGFSPFSAVNSAGGIIADSGSTYL